MRTHFKRFRPAARQTFRRGSALLIVLGFLSFMIISAVSFAIYMRVERQASSNYRHSVMARHLLNAALFRAIDEVDAELRLRRDGNTIRKFPETDVAEDEWPGRVKASALDDELYNERDARVLSLEALSYLPPFLVNDVRRFAVYDTNDGNSKRYLGAKWRQLKRLPDEEGIGRYAYVCVNLSDMFDVNQCNAALRDASTNRVSVGHLLDATWRNYYEQDKQKDIRYFSLQDFYAARHDHHTGEESSPYHAFLADGEFTHFDESFNWDQLYCTESIAKPEPTNGVACNILVNPPFSATFLNRVKPSTSDLSFDDTTGDKPFWTALRRVVSGVTYDNTREQMMSAMIKDYIDPDPVPTQLSMPCTEMVPMINQIVINNAIVQPEIFSQSVPAPAGSGLPNSIQYGIRLIKKTTVDGGQMPLYVEVTWPFKYFENRSLPSFRVRGVWCFKIVKNSCNTHSSELMTTYQVEMESTEVSAPSFSQTAIGADENASCRQSILIFNAPSATDNEVLLIKDDGTPLSSFAATDEIRVACTMWLQVVTTYKGSEYVVDQVPCMVDDPTLNRAAALAIWKSNTPKLYFQTDSTVVGDLSAKVGQFLQYQSNSLEIPDPRFNYNAINWIGGTEASGQVDERVNQSTRDLLADGLGRDRDSFMSVSDTGMLQSPGELGFVIRPYNWEADYGLRVDFSVQTSVAAMDARNLDKNAMFRTYRLYDHGASTGNNFVHDPIYENFFVMEGDGTMKGQRVNPLSDIPEVLEAAIWGTPLDFWLASTNCPLTEADKKLNTFNVSNLQFDKDTDKWEDFRDEWADAMGTFTLEVNKEWKRTVADYYGDWNYMKWYSDDGTRMTVFNKSNLLKNPLHEIDRKMLYAFSLDSFSDRQQLFLYILRAEATSPAFGSGSDGLRSLAGGRAVAIVWRDPYPRGYNKGDNTYMNSGGTMVDVASSVALTRNDWYPNNSLVSPWDQYTYNRGKNRRYNGYHDTRILFFKQLDQ